MACSAAGAGASLEGVFGIPRERLGGDHVLLWRSLGACMLAMAPWGASIKVRNAHRA